MPREEMELDNLRRDAREHLRRLLDNEYPGRGLIVGRSADGERLLQVYWIMGRSENSRNRVFEASGPVLRTAAADPSRMEDPSLVIYTAMREVGPCCVVSNGDHTDTVAEALEEGGTFEAAMRSRAHEPDAPNWTPRIAGLLMREEAGARATLAVIKADPFDAQRSLHQFYDYPELPAGFGWCITTYRGDGTPLPPFIGEPYILPLDGNADVLADRLWNHLNGENRVALAVKTIDAASGRSEIVLRNRFQAKG